MPHAPATNITKVPEIRKGDTIVVLNGKDAGKRGVVDRVLRNPRGKVLGARKQWQNVTPLADVSVAVEGLNIAKRHTKARQRSTSSGGIAGAPRVDPGGILDVAQPIAISNVMLVCPRCDNPTRIGHVALENGKRVRVCRHCGEQLEVKTI